MTYQNQLISEGGLQDQMLRTVDHTKVENAVSIHGIF